MENPVVLNVYDLSNGLARTMSQRLIGTHLEGIWHTGIVVYGKEFYFGGGICQGHPGQTPYGNPIDIITLGTTLIPEDLFMDFLRDLSPSFSQSTYDLFKNNCNHFTDECSQFLIGNGIPKHIVDLPLQALKTPMGRQISNMVGNMQHQANSQSHPLFDPRAMEGANNPQAMNFSLPDAAQIVQELSGQLAYNQAINTCDACIIDIFADWCGPCNKIKPFFASLKSRYPQFKFFKVEMG